MSENKPRDKPQGKPDAKETVAATGVVKIKKAAPTGGIHVVDVRKKRQVALGAVLAPIMEPALAKQGVLLAQIVPHWRAICPLLANHSSPESVRGDTLTVAVASDGVKQELFYITPQIIEGIARLLGYAAIAKVRAITRHDVGKGIKVIAQPMIQATSSVDRDKAAGLCKSVRDDELRAALGRLGAEILRTEKKK